jgi:hypothetical protein
MLEGQDTSISESKGMKTWFVDNLDDLLFTNDNPLSNNSIVGYFDRRYNEVVFSILCDKSTTMRPNIYKETIAFNEMFKAYNGFYDQHSSFYLVTNKNEILSSFCPRQGVDVLYLHNVGDACSFYGTTYKTTLGLLGNAAYSNVKTFDSLAIIFESFLNDVNDSDDFFNRIRCFNNHQNTDWNEIVTNQALTPTGKFIESNRRERTWKMHFPRNFVDKVVGSNPDIFSPINLADINRMFKERLRSQSVNIEFEYDNTNKNIIHIPNIIVNVRLSIR